MSRRARTAVVVLLLVWLAWVVADTFWLFVAGPSALVPVDDTLPTLGLSREPAGAPVDVARIRQWELFGAPGETAAPVAAEAPETRLRLELLGVFQHPDQDQASAIIAEQGKEGELYQPGDRVPGNATLEEVLTDRVILLRMGQREALRLKEPDLDGNVALSRPAPSRPDGGDRSEGALAGPEAQFGQPDLTQQRSLIIERLGLTPAETGGYLISEGAPEQILQAVGLQAGDVLVSVNGHELGTEPNDLAALQEFRSSGSATIVVQRGPQRFTVNYPP